MAFLGNARNQSRQQDDRRSEAGGTKYNNRYTNIADAANLEKPFPGAVIINPTAADYVPDFRVVAIKENSGGLAGGAVVIETPEDTQLTLNLQLGETIAVHCTGVYAAGSTITNLILWK